MESTRKKQLRQHKSLQFLALLKSCPESLKQLSPERHSYSDLCNASAMDVLPVKLSGQLRGSMVSHKKMEIYLFSKFLAQDNDFPAF